MSSPSPTLDVLETVARREPLLSSLAEQPRDKRDLVDHLDCSRSTIDRAVRELEWLEFVDRTDGTYRLTAAGRLALAEHRRSAAVFESIETRSHLLGHMPPDAPMSAAMLEGSEATEPPSHAPNEPLQELTCYLDRADRVRAIAGAERIPQLRRRLYDRTVNGDLDAELLMTDDLAEFIVAEYPEQVHDLAVAGAVDFYVVDSLPYELTIFELPTGSQVFLFAIQETDIKAVLTNDSQAALEWATGVYRRFRTSAKKLSPPE
ncbi:helix-turn-helix transcriptional regulator [Halosolutus gelatinilyticus]|uniref:helix-turn-helix transcriptional regulator n=1 Tax=Halosolutus gelatinilyticus TaxID=2931975 RepID=UPI001FF4C1AC|nr:transcriptional regulator [Halosolutus gelatinilyticus]